MNERTKPASRLVFGEDREPLVLPDGTVDTTALSARVMSSGLVNFFDKVPPGTAVEQFSEQAWKSYKYSAVQAPIDGLTQLLDHSLQTNILPNVQIFEQPEPQEIGSAGWHGQVVGSTLGVASQMAILHRLVGPGATSKLELTSSYGLGVRAFPALGKAAVTGAVYSGVFQPVGNNENFSTARLRNAAVGSLTALSLTSSSIALKSSGVKLLRNDTVAGALSGAPAGFISAESQALMAEGRLASRDEIKQSMATFALGGGMMGAVNSAHEFLKPTSGIRGVRSLEDMTRLAESTRAPNFEQLAKAVSLPARNHARLFQSTARSLNGSSLSGDEKVLVARGHRDLVDSFEQLKSVGPTVTIYGSARLAEDTFAYQRTRYTAGKLAENGWAVMTGGGEKGIMRAANQGAFEAGGKSIGVNVELPFEQKPNPFQTISLEHKNFFTRKEALRKADAFIIEEGGLGTLDEAMEVLTLAQTGKIQKTPPIYFVGRETYRPVEDLLNTLVRHGTVSPKDLGLFKVVDDPNKIIRDLSSYRQSR